MARHAARHRREVARRRPRRSLSVALTLLVVVCGQDWSSGAWSSSAPPTAIREVQAGILGTATSPSATQTPGGHTVQLGWGAVSLATAYEVRHYTTATGGTPTVACTSTTLRCVDATPRSGSAHWYSVVARIGTRWMSESARTPYASDDTASVTTTALGSDTGSSGTDFITRTASNTLTGTAEAGATIAVKRGGSTIATATANASGAWTSTSFTLTEGLQSLDAVATDAFANTATATRGNVRLDTAAPNTGQSAPCAVPGNSSWCKQTSLTWTASFSDAGSGLAPGTSQYRLDGGAFTAYAGAVSLGETNGRVVQTRATDVAGNQGTSSATYYIDGTAPTLSITAPPPGLSLSLTLLGPLLSDSCGGKAACGTASDAVSGLPSITSVGWKLQRGSTCYVASGGGTCTGYQFQAAGGTLPAWTTTVGDVYMLLSSYVLTIQAVDAAGNLATVTRNFSTLL